MEFIKSLGASIDLSTCVSAARLKIPIGLYSSIPGMKVYTPYDSVTAIEYLENWLVNPSQIALRLERQPMPFNIFTDDEEFERNELGIITKRNS